MSDSRDTSLSGSFLSSSLGKKVSGQIVDKAAGNKSCCPSLTLKQRIIGFGICTGLGKIKVNHNLYVCRIDYQSFVIWHFVFCHHWKYYQICNSLHIWYSIEFCRVSHISFIKQLFNILHRSFFLSGPLNQLKKMFQRKRVITTIVCLSSIVMTLVSAIVIKKAVLVIIFVIIQYCSYFWYSLSFIPYGRDIFCKCIKRNRT